MILADSSVWIDHLRRPEPMLQALLDAELIASHPYVLLEVSLGSLADRARLFAELRRLPATEQASLDDVTALTERHPLWSRGIGFADAAILAATSFDRLARLWTMDRRLRALAEEVGIAAEFA